MVNNQVLRLLLIVLMVFVYQPLSAGEIQHATVHYAKGVYQLDIDAIINAEFDAVYAIVSDYERLDRLSDILIESSLINSPDAELKRLRLLVRSCFLIFCFTVKTVNDLHEISKEKIITTVVPEESDFKSGKTTWQLQPDGSNRSRMHFSGNLEPAFWIPPVIGPLIVKRKIITKAVEILEEIELLSKDA